MAANESGKKNGKKRVSGRRRRSVFRRKLSGISRRKLTGLFLAVVAALIVLLIRMAGINLTHGGEYTKQVLANNQSQYQSVSIAYKRGDILDSTGTTLATSVKQYRVILDCYAVNSDSAYKEPTEKALSDVFGIDTSTIDALLTGDGTKNSRYQVLLGGSTVTIKQKQAWDAYVDGTDDSSLSDEEKETRATDIQGVWFEEKYGRSYPLGSLACDVLGFVYDTDKAAWGIESYYNNTLSGVDGRKYAYYGSGTQLEQTIAAPVDGKTVELTLDANIQKAVEDTIESFNETYANGPYYSGRGAKNIGVVVMNPNTGAVFAMASSDPYDLNDPSSAISTQYTDEQIAAMSDDQKTEALESIWKNFCISDSYEPGSVYKPVVISSALQNGTLTGNETFYCDGGETVLGTRIKCSDPYGHGQETVGDLIKNSCNDGLMQVASLMGIDEFSQYQQMFGFGSRTGIDLSGEASGIINSADQMSALDLAVNSFGQGFTCTMIQEITAVSAVINGGNLVKPHLMSQVLNSDGSVEKTYGTVVQKEIISKDVSDLVRSYMKKSTDEGTSAYAKVDGYSMGGKTGTAQKIPRGNGKYLDSYIGFVPYNNPQVVIYVVVDEPNVEAQADNRYPQWIGRDILQQILPYMGISPDEASNPDNPYLQFDYTNPTGEQDVDEAADTNVPEVSGTEDASDTAGGNTEETDGYTNEEAGLDNTDD